MIFYWDTLLTSDLQLIPSSSFLLTDQDVRESTIFAHENLFSAAFGFSSPQFKDVEDIKNQERGKTLHEKESVFAATSNLQISLRNRIPYLYPIESFQ
jgi:hypothetical protein